MNPHDCQSIIQNRAKDAEFYEFNALAKVVRAGIDAFRNKQGHASLQSFEISEQLTIPLQNLDDLYTMLFTENEKALSEAQKKYLKDCEGLVAHCYCYIQHFIDMDSNGFPKNDAVDISEGTRKLNHEFYYHASYELRTPALALRVYSEPQSLTDMRINSSPFVPENQDIFDKISYWAEELLKFINDLPNIWRAFKPEDAA